MKIYILGICGTFMAGLALLARERGFEVEGSDAQVYPPMSLQLEDAGIQLHEGYEESNLSTNVDLYIIGNAISRGNPQFEAILNRNLPYISGPQWLYENILKNRWVLAVAGTHGKTTTSSMLAWILEYSGLNPGYLIGGMSQNFTQSARLGKDPFFVIEADEYDTSIFDKRSKFVHYHPRTLILNNLEFDHADIFDDLKAIQRQFHHLLRMLPGNGLIIHNRDVEALHEVIAEGCWSELLGFSSFSSEADFYLDENNRIVDSSKQKTYHLEIAQAGRFNAMNACAAVLAARHAGIPIETSIAAMHEFTGVKRRQETIAEIRGIRIIDDFAHHPEAIRLTLEALKNNSPGRLFAVIEIRSNTMKMGSHADSFAASIKAADFVLIPESPNLKWDLHAMAQAAENKVLVTQTSEQIIEHLAANCTEHDQIVIMSNGGFDNIHQRLISALQSSQ